MMRSSNAVTRRGALRVAAQATGLVAVQVAGLAASRPASAQPYGQTPKTVVKYQDTPKDGHDCLNCAQFIPGTSAGGNGHCKLVAGDISPHGWCIVWSAKK